MDSNERYVHCCVKNCSRKILKEDAIVIGERYFCKLCGVAYFRSKLNI